MHIYILGYASGHIKKSDGLSSPNRPKIIMVYQAKVCEIIPTVNSLLFVREFRAYL